MNRNRVAKLKESKNKKKYQITLKCYSCDEQLLLPKFSLFAFPSSNLLRTRILLLTVFVYKFLLEWHWNSFITYFSSLWERKYFKVEQLIKIDLNQKFELRFNFINCDGIKICCLHYAPLLLLDIRLNLSIAIFNFWKSI